MRLWRSSIARRTGVQTQHVVVSRITDTATGAVYGTYDLASPLNRAARRARAAASVGGGSGRLPQGGIFDDALPFETVLEFDEDEALSEEDEDAADAEAKAFWAAARDDMRLRRRLQNSTAGAGAGGIDIGIQVITSDLNGENPDAELLSSIVSFIRSTTARFILEDWLRECAVEGLLRGGAASTPNLPLPRLVQSALAWCSASLATTCSS